jgi:hypothetical protein
MFISFKPEWQLAHDELSPITAVKQRKLFLAVARKPGFPNDTYKTENFSV